MRITHCSACGHQPLTDILSLGTTPLANALLTKEQLDQPVARFPLDLVFCSRCALVQITERVPPETLFGEYLYFSSFSDFMKRHAQKLVEQLIAERGLDKDSLVVEIASNDGYLLSYLVAAGVPVLGIEPAKNIAKVAVERGIPTLTEFFGRDLAGRLAAEGRRADLMIANNVMAHVPDIGGVIAGIATVLKPGGVFVMETPYVKDLVDHLEFDTIYHEHLFYYSLTALEHLYRSHGLAAARVERISTHGGSLRVSVVHASSPEARGPSVAQMLAEEEAWGVGRHDFYKDFGERVNGLLDRLRGLLSDLKGQGKRLAAYGAAAKGTTLLSSLGLGAETIDFCVDRSTYKQGRWMPGSRIPILPPEHLLEAQPDHVLLLAWNLAEEVMAQQGEYRQRGGHFIVPLPEPRVV
jgi:SAM-dependent methyltransferase